VKAGLSPMPWEDENAGKEIDAALLNFLEKLEIRIGEL
jgi:hypothetical protein